jgi:hypothetical protein
MDAPYAATLDTLAAGRVAAVVQLRQLAERLEQLPLDAVAEVLVLLEPCSTTCGGKRPSRSSVRPLARADARAALPRAIRRRRTAGRDRTGAWRRAVACNWGSVPDPQLDEDSENNGPMWPPPDDPGGSSFKDDALTSIEERAAR